MMRRFFEVDDQWCIIHIPERPNGFGILIIGDSNHYVDESTSLWIQSQQRFELIKSLCNEGYTVFYSNLYGANWGAPKAVEFLIRFYHIVLREEILNKSIHIIAEGMGAFGALELTRKMEGKIRSLSLLNPCLDLKSHVQTEKDNKLFYKRIIKEMATAYDIEEKEVVKKIIEPFNLNNFQLNTPMKIWHATDRVAYKFSAHSRKFEKIQSDNGSPVSLALHLFEKRFYVGKDICKFLKKHEKLL
jgi:hypothetical protein